MTDVNVETLSVLNEFRDFIENIEVVADMGCGLGADALWWTTLTNDEGKSREIKINAVDYNVDTLRVVRHRNITYHESDFSNTDLEHNSQDFVWAYNSLQYSLNPIQTLSHWWDIMKTDAMLLITLPYNFSVNDHRDSLKIDTEYQHNCYFNWTLGNLIMSLVATGFDCRNSHFKIDKDNRYMQAAVYKLAVTPDVKMTWYQMCDKKMLPLCIEEAIMKNGNFKETDIVCEWIDRTQYILNL